MGRLLLIQSSSADGHLLILTGDRFRSGAAGRFVFGRQNPAPSNAAGAPTCALQSYCRSAGNEFSLCPDVSARAPSDDRMGRKNSDAFCDLSIAVSINSIDGSAPKKGPRRLDSPSAVPQHFWKIRETDRRLSSPTTDSTVSVFLRTTARRKAPTPENTPPVTTHQSHCAPRPIAGDAHLLFEKNLSCPPHFHGERCTQIRQRLKLRWLPVTEADAVLNADLAKSTVRFLALVQC